MTNKEAIRILKAKLACMDREVSGTNEDCNKQNCLNCDLSYKQGTMGEQMEVLQMAIDALDKDTNVVSKGDDTISRQAAIDAVSRGCEEFRGIFAECEKNLNELSPAQLEPCEDCVSRKAVIRLLHSGYHSKSMIEEVKELPSAQPDYKTDHGYMWLCPKCGLQVHSDFIKCPRCGLVRHDTQQEIGITRCMYCKNWVPGYITDNDEFIPPKCGKYQQMVGHNHDDFCSLAERKEKCINAEEKAGL